MGERISTVMPESQRALVDSVGIKGADLEDKFLF